MIIHTTHTDDKPKHKTQMKYWFIITLFHYSSKNPIAVIEKLYTSYGRALVAADKYAKRYKCNYIVKQLTNNDMRKFIV